MCVTSTSADLWQAAIVALLRDLEAQLSHSVKNDNRVHASRRAAKQVRALSLLAPPSLEPLATETRTHADVLRRSLGHARDAAVRRQTLDRLFARADENAERLRALLGLADEDTPEASGPVSSHGEFAALAGRWTEIARGDVTRAALTDAIARTYRRARRRAKAARNGDARKTHRWRRAIVDLNLQVGIFAEGAPRLARITKRAHRLRELLGRYHDIDALTEFLARAPDIDAPSLTAFRKAAKDERKRLMRKITRCAKRLLKRKPALWKDRLAASFYAAERDVRPAG